MKIFVSWSGALSRALAEAVKDWLIVLFPTFDIWVSSEDIRAGDRWFHELASRLSETNFGIICLTKENLHSPWLLFEAGALSKSMDAGRIVPLLADLEYGELQPPFSFFQAVKADEIGMRRLVQTLSALLPNNRRSDAAIERIFSLTWPDFPPKLQQPEQLINRLPSSADGKKLPVITFRRSNGSVVDINGIEIALSEREQRFYAFLAKRCLTGAASFPYYKAAYAEYEAFLDTGERHFYGPDTLSGIVSSIRKKFERAGLTPYLPQLLPAKGRIGIRASVTFSDD